HRPHAAARQLANDVIALGRQSGPHPLQPGGHGRGTWQNFHPTSSKVKQPRSFSPEPSLAAYGLRLTAYGLRLAAYFTVIVIFIPSATCGMQYALYVPAGAPATETSHFCFGCGGSGARRATRRLVSS